MVGYTDVIQETAFDEVREQTVNAPGQPARFGQVELPIAPAGYFYFLFLLSGPLDRTAAQCRASAFNWQNNFRLARH
jgi:hypothetical protein